MHSFVRAWGYPEHVSMVRSMLSIVPLLMNTCPTLLEDGVYLAVWPVTELDRRCRSFKCSGSKCILENYTSPKLCPSPFQALYGTQGTCNSPLVTMALLLIIVNHNSYDGQHQTQPLLTRQWLAAVAAE